MVIDISHECHTCHAYKFSHVFSRKGASDIFGDAHCGKLVFGKSNVSENDLAEGFTALVTSKRESSLPGSLLRPTAHGRI